MLSLHGARTKFREGRKLNFCTEWGQTHGHDVPLASIYL
jgi:hypothetical protein